MTTDSDTRNKMRAGVRRRGTRGKWAYTVNLGLAPAQRCVACGHREWLGHKRLEACPACDGALRDTCERRQEQKGGFATRAEAVRARTRALHELGDGAHVLRSDVTLRQFLQDEWLPGIEGQIKESTLRSYTQHVQDHIAPRLGDHQLQRLTAREIQKVCAVMAKGGRADGGKGALSPATVRRVHATLHRAGKDAVRWQRLSVNPVDAADPPRGKAEQRDLPAWSGEQLASFLASVRDERLFCLWRLLAMTGARRGEALGLTWDDLDLEAGTITIRRALVPMGAEVLVSEPKTRRGRRAIALDPLTLEALKAHAARQADERSACEDWVESGYIFTTADGRPLDPHRTSKAFERHLRAAALPRIPLHGLRHTYATLALSSGVNPRIVSGRLGHSTVALTLDIYSHVLPQADQEAADRIAALIER